MTSTVKSAPAAKKAVATKVEEQKANEAPAVEKATVVEAPAKKYDPASDSTPELQARASKEGRVILDLSNNACLCGCKGVSASRFQPGHDARLKGKLVRATMADVKLLIIMGKDEQEVTPRQFAQVLKGKYDWVKGLDESVARLELAEKAAAERREENAKKLAERRAAAAEKGKGKISLSDFAK
jgi:hypothetical protein